MERAGGTVARSGGLEGLSEVLQVRERVGTARPRERAAEVASEVLHVRGSVRR